MHSRYHLTRRLYTTRTQCHGDRYKGTRFGRDNVAIKQMRVGMIDKSGFDAFTKEVLMLAQLHHPNVVTFVGYVLVSPRCSAGAR